MTRGDAVLPAPPPWPSGPAPRLAVIAGSGMDGLAARFAAAAAVPFDAIEGVGACSVVGHRGEVRLCRRGGLRWMLVLGRRHAYEGAAPAMERLVGALAAWGARSLVTMSAAGGLHRALVPGTLVVVRDVVDLQNRRADAAGTRGPERGARTLALDPALTARLEGAVRAARAPWARGTLACLTGPTYETPAEVSFVRRAGADVVTMSAAPEIVAASAHGLHVAALAAVTNAATGVGGAVPRHDEVVDVASGTGEALARVIGKLLETEAVTS